jgi:hypothetical protein
MKKRASAKAPARRKRTAKPPAEAQVVVAKPVAEPLVTVKMVDAAIPYAEVTIHEPLTETSMERIFESSRGELLRYQPRRVLVDVRNASIALSISDMNGLVKLIAAHFASKVERLAIVLRPVDMPPESFVEPSLSNRGLPTIVTQDFDEAVGWITAKLLRPH